MKKIVWLYCIITLAGCHSEDLDFDNIVVPDLQGNYNFPIGNVTYRLDTLIKQVDNTELDLLIDPQTSEIKMVYRDSISYGASEEIIEIEGINKTQPAKDLPYGMSGPADIAFQQTLSFEYSSTEKEERIDSVFYDEGLLFVRVNATLDLDYTVIVESTRTIDTNEAATFTGSVRDKKNTPSSPNPIDLGSPRYKTTIDNTTDQSSLNVSLSASISLPAGRTITEEDSIFINVQYASQEFSLIYGDFAQDTITMGEQILSLDFFDDIESDGFFFGNPSMNFHFDNEIGVPFAADFSALYGDKGEGSTPLFLEGDIIDNPSTIAAAITPDISSQSSITIDKTNSNLVDLLATSPDRLIFDVKGRTNPDPLTSTNNFIAFDDSIRAAIVIEIPMEVRLVDLEQTGTLDLSGGIDTKDVESLYMRLFSVNELPFTAQLSVEIKDADSLTVYQVADKIVLEAPRLDETGKVISAATTIADIPIDSEGVDALAAASHLKLTATLNTPGQAEDTFVTLLADYELTLKVGLGGKLSVDL